MALTVDRTTRQWVDLGIHTEACMTQPDTCGAAGGAISMWVRVTDCPGIIGRGIVSLQSDQKTGFSISCSKDGIGCVNLIPNTLQVLFNFTI